MKQLIQDIKRGATEVLAVPAPQAASSRVLIRSARTLISVGTERMLVEFGRANLIQKARQQPEKVRQVLDKAKTDGVTATLDTVRTKLDQPLPLGYCNVGAVIEVGAEVNGFQVGQRVVSNGHHAQIVSVPQNLCAGVPDGVADDQAAFTVLGAIALQGIRLVQPTLGEAIVVSGLGLIGLLTVQLLRAHGCRVLGLDFDATKLRLAEQFGAQTVDLSKDEDPLAAAQSFSRQRGVDGVIITAATKSSEPVHQAALMSRKRGRIVLVGVTGLELSRADFYEKELTFQVSCSYGPGRYDPGYEERGHDYPVGFVRWTEQRNFEAVLDMLSSGRLDVEPLISHRFAIEDAAKAYEVVGGSEPSLGILLEYPDDQQISTEALTNRTIKLREPRLAAIPSTPVIGFIGSGSYATGVLIPAFTQTDARLRSVASNGGVSGVHAARKFGFEITTTDTGSVLDDPEINTIVIATRHDSHAHLVCAALRRGKNVFVEKPLALTETALKAIEEAYAEAAGGANRARLMVGFNRRFAPHVVRIRELLSHVKEPKAFIMTVNAGHVPQDHWTQDPAVGGGRIIGEGCHFVDLLRHLAGAPIVRTDAVMMGAHPDISVRHDKVAITLTFSDGSIGTVHYLGNGHKSFPKERLEVFAAGRVLQLDNFRRLSGYGWPGFRSQRSLRQDKGNKACVAAFVDALRAGEDSPIPFEELVEATRITLAVVDQLQ